jgi:hypothetical protein
MVLGDAPEAAVCGDVWTVLSAIPGSHMLLADSCFNLTWSGQSSILCSPKSATLCISSPSRPTGAQWGTSIQTRGFHKES